MFREGTEASKWDTDGSRVTARCREYTVLHCRRKQAVAKKQNGRSPSAATRLFRRGREKTRIGRRLRDVQEEGLFRSF
jgi:hypothetical protein